MTCGLLIDPLFLCTQYLMETESTPLLLRPAPWDPRRSAVAGGLVLVTLTLERLAFYALVANLFLFLSLGGWSPRGSMTAVLILVGVAHFSALGGGWLADGLVCIIKLYHSYKQE